MGRTILVFAPLVLAALPAVAQAETVTLSPEAEWQSEGDSNRCRVSRVFGEGAARHILILEQFYPDDRVDMTLAGPAFGKFAGSVRSHLNLAEGEAPVWVTPLDGTVPGFGPGLVLSGIRVGADDRAEAGYARRPALPQIRPHAHRLTEFVTISQRGREVRLQTGALDEALSKLDACTQDLAAGWGLDVAQLRSASSRPQWVNRQAVHGDIANTFAEHFKFNSQTEGIAHLRVIVNEAGQPEDCTVTYATVDMKPNNRACRIMQRARFEPARDSEGRPIRAYYTASFKDRRRGALSGFAIPQ